jgi:PAS domain S-box-containing protein
LNEDHYQNIIGLLKDTQKGLTIKEISKNLNLSRITTTKYLNSLFVSGQVNMRKVGPAKSYTLSTRLPFDQILGQSSDLILVLDETYSVRNVNDSFLLAFGIAKDHIENKNINKTFLGPGLIDRIRDPVRKGMAGKESVSNVWVPVQKDWKAFRIRIIPLVFGWGEKGVVIMFEDRTGEIMAHEENALLADLANSSPAAITVSDFFGNFLYSNKKNLDLHGYSLSEFLDLNLEQIDKSEKHISERLEDLKKSGEASFEVLHFRKDGQQIPLEVHSTIARWGDRDVVISIATDISERKRAEQAIKESERRFAEIIDFLPDATLVVNSGGTVIAWNHAIEEMTGVKARDIVGRGDYAYAVAIHGERRRILLDLIFQDDPEVRNTYQYLQKEGNTFTAETVLTPPGAGERFVWMKASPFYDRDGRIIGAVETIRDITERKRAGEAVQAMVTSMVGTTGMDSLDRITESISTWLGADCIMIGEITPDKSHVQVLSMLLDGKKIADYSYTLEGTPCENTAEKGFCMYPDEVCTLFPESSDLRKFNIRGYAGTPVRNFEGQVVGILCILTRKPLILPPSAREIFDIIAVKAAAEIGRRNALWALHESERKFRTIFENSPYPIAINSYPDTKFLEVNEAFLKSSGYTETEVLGKNPVELGLLSLMDSARLGTRMVMAGRLENVPLTLTGKGGRRVHVQFSAVPIPINDQRVIVTMAAEVTKLKQVEEELHQQNLVLETINQLALEFASLPRGNTVPQQAVKSLMKLSGAAMTLFNTYDPSDSTLQVTSFEIAPGMLKKIIGLLGKRPGEMKVSVSDGMYQEMVHNIIGRRKTLAEASFGQIPPLVSMSIQKMMDIDHFIGIAYVIEGKLYGTSLLGMKPGQPDPSTELLESFAHIVAISLRRDRVEQGS